MLDPHPKRVNVGCAGDVLLAVVAIILVLNEPSMPTHHLVELPPPLFSVTKYQCYWRSQWVVASLPH